MNTSESFADLAAALAKAQAKMRHAAKSAVNDHWKKNYADLASVINACREALAENDLAVLQTTRLGEGAHVLVTTLLHKTGQFISGEMPILAKSNDPQAFGSALTYARRYAFAAIVGVAQDDDDAELGQGRVQQAPAAAQNRPTSAPRSSSSATNSSNDNQDPAHVALATEFKRRLGDLEGLHLFGDFVRDLEAAGLPRPLLDDVRAEVVVLGVRFAVEQEDLEAWVPKLQEWKLEGEPRDRAAQAWERRSDELATQGRAA